MPLHECVGWWLGWFPLLPTHGLRRVLLLLRSEAAAGVLRPWPKKGHPRSTDRPTSRSFVRRTFGRFADVFRPCPAAREQNRRVASRLSGIAQTQLVFYPWRPVDGLLQPVLLHFGVVLFGQSLVGIRSKAASFGPVQDTLVGSTPL